MSYSPVTGEHEKKKNHQSILYQIESSGVLIITTRGNFVYFNCSKINNRSYEFIPNESWSVDSLFPPLSHIEIVIL